MAKKAKEKDPAKTGGAGPPARIIVGIGASAGGLEALRALLPALPTGANMVYVVAQHMDPNHPSLLKELLSRISPMPVREVTDGLDPLGGTVYVTPPAHNVSYSGGRLRLEAVSHIGPKPSIDNFFISLAEAAGPDCAGIILSGTGSDGAHGIRAIKAAGGLTFCQDDATAKYNGMPRAAAETGLVDVVQSPEQIGAELGQLLAQPAKLRPLATSGRGKTAFEQICQLLLTQTNCDFRNYKASTLQRRIARRMSVHKLSMLDDYVALLRQSPQELEALFKDILISVTSFFRDAESYAALDRVIRQIVQQRRGTDGIRVWVAGVATGEEAYSIAILFDRAITELGANVSYQIFATDIDVDALAIARRGVYMPSLLKNVPPALVERYFVRKDDTYHVVKRIRERVVFARQDLVRDPPFSRLDLISCRNLLIYFNQRLQKQVISLFHYVLRTGGYLFLGKSEAIGPHTDLFEPAEKGLRIFRALASVNPAPPDFAGLGARPTSLSAEQRGAESPRPQRSLNERMEQALLRHLAPIGAVVDDRGNVLHITGDVSGLLQLPAGRMDTNIASLIRDDLRIELRALLHKARREGPTRGQPVRIALNGQDRLVTLEVLPLEADSDESRAYLVLFRIDDERPLPADGGETARGEDLRMQELEQELIATREHLQTTIEELETSNEELQSTNEELQSANEELQSANEELETSNEELQSTNEELATVNEELQVKTGELATANSDLENVLAIIGLPLLVVDNRLRLTRYTQAATQIFNVKASDIGEVLTTLECRLPLPNLRNHILSVIQDEREYREHIFAGGESWQLRIQPYYSEQRRAIGAVLVFEGAREKNLSFASLVASGGVLTKLLMALEPACLIINEAGTIVAANPATERLFGHPVEELHGRNVSMLMPDPYRSNHDAYIANYVATGERHMIGRKRVVTGLRRDGGRITLELDVVEAMAGDMRLFVGFMRETEA